MKKKRKVKRRVQKKKKEDSVQWWSILTLVAIIIVVLVLVFQGRGGATASPGEVAAKVNGESISVEELDTQFGRLPPQYQQSISKQVLLTQMIDEVLLLQEAKRQGYEATDFQVDTIIQESLVLSGLSEQEFYSRLAKDNITKDYLKAFYKKQIVINDLLNDTILANIKVSDKDIAAEYEANKETFKIPELRKASHILFLVTEEQDDKAAEKKAKDIQKKATAKNFADLAEEHSEDPGSAPRGGNLGQFAQGTMVPAFDKEVFSMKEGEISDPIRTQFGYHIIYLEEIFKERTQKLEEVEDKIKSQLSVQQQRNMYEKYVADLREDAKIELLYVGDAPAGASTFQTTGDELCTDKEGKPIVRMFSLSTCPHCKWVRETFNKVAEEYVKAGKITAYHFQLDTKDDELTAATETEIPPTEVAAFDRYSPAKQVPLFVMGCKYKRVGNGYERENNLAKEEAEFRAILDEITA